MKKNGLLQMDPKEDLQETSFLIVISLLQIVFNLPLLSIWGAVAPWSAGGAYGFYYRVVPTP